MQTTLIHSIFDVLIPPRCHICGDTLTPDEQFICGLCHARLPRTGYHSRPDNPMELRFAGKFPFRHAVAHFFYTRDSSIASLIHDFKYRNFPSLARNLGRIIGKEMQAVGALNDIDCIFPIPIHWTKRLHRGYNQTEFLAKGISDITDIPVSLDLITRRSHRTQTHLTPEERIRNTSGIFRLRHSERYSGIRAIILDDVCTTGSTLTAAAEAILDPIPDADLTLLTLAATF